MSQTELSYEETRQKIIEGLYKHPVGVLATTSDCIVTSREMRLVYFEFAYNEYLAEGKNAEVQLISINPRRATLYVSGKPAISAGYTAVGCLEILNIEKRQAYRVGVYEYRDSPAYYE